MTSKVWVPPPVGFHTTATSASVAAWIEDFRLAMLEIGLEQTSDGGQFDYSSFVYSATAGEKAYMMFAFTDELQATHPIFVRVAFLGYYLTGGAMAVGASISIGTETNGSGLITKNKVDYSRSIAYQYGGDMSRAFSHQSFASFSKAKGCLGVAFNAGRNGTLTDVVIQYAPVGFFLERIPDESGQPTGLGYSVWSCNQTSTMQYSNYSATDIFESVAVLVGCTQVLGKPVYSGVDMIPYFQTADFLNPDLFAMHAYHTTPHPIRSNGLVAIPAGRVAKGTEFGIQVYGEVESNFVALDHTSGMRPCSSRTGAVLGFLFE